MAAPAPPTNVTPTVDANDQITLTWDYDPTWFAFDGDDGSLGGFDEGRWYSDSFVDHFEIEFSRDGIGYKDPSGGPSSVTYDESTSYSKTYGPNSDKAYGTQVGIDSMFKFRVRAVNADGASEWTSSTTVYTEPIPPHNPYMTRDGANSITYNWTSKSDISDYVYLDYRKDTGAGYGSWSGFGYTTDDGQWTGTVSNRSELEEDARYQFRIKSEKRDSNNNLITSSDWVFVDYGNSGNVYFEDDFESGDLSAWDITNESADTGVVDSTFTDPEADDDDFSTNNRTMPVQGPDEGTYYLFLDSDSIVGKNLGDLSGESDVIVKAAVATSSLDSTNTDQRLDIEWYDGSAWKNLHYLSWEYNRAGWVEVTALVPSGDLSADNRVRFNSPAFNGDYGAIDRVVVSDILHEYTKPAAHSNLTLDSSVDREITASWTANGSFWPDHSGDIFTGVEYRPSGTSNWSVSYAQEGDLGSEVIAGLLDGEEYEFRLDQKWNQYRHGEHKTWFGQKIGTKSTTTILPAPSNLSPSASSDTSLDLSWVDESNDESGFRVHAKSEEILADNFSSFDSTKWTLSGDATYNSSETAVQLTPATGGQKGHLTYDGSVNREVFHVDVNWRIGDATDDAADALDIHVCSNSNSSTGFQVNHDHWGERIRLIRQSDDTVVQTSNHNFGSSNTSYHSEVIVDDGTIIVKLDGTEHINYTVDETELTGDVLKLYAWTGGSNAQHLVDEVTVSEGTEKSAWRQVGDLGSNITNHTVSSLSEDTTYQLKVESYTDHTATESSTASATTFLTTTRTSRSYSSPGTSTSLRVIDLLESVESHGASASSDNLRIVDLLEDVTSSSHAGSSAASRVINLGEEVSSHASPSNSDSIGVIDVSYGVSSHLSKVEDWDITHGAFVTDRVWEGDNSFYSSENHSNEQARWTPFDSGEQVESFTYYWQELSTSYGGGIRFVNSNGEYELGLATDNPAWMIDDANGEREVAAGGDGYDHWVRFTVTFDWANNTFDVDFESYGTETTYQESGIPLKNGVDIQRLELWNYHDNNTWGDGNLDMWWDSFQFTESDGTTTETLTGTGNSSAFRVTDVLANASSHLGASTSSNQRSGVNFNQRSPDVSYLNTSTSLSERIVDLLALPASHLAASDSDSSRLASLNRLSQSHSAALDSSALRVVDLIGTVSSHSSAANSMVSTLIDMLAAPESSLALSDSTSDRGSLSYAGRRGASSVPAIDSNSIRIVDLLESVESHSKSGSSFTYNERTSLEVVDQNINWDDGNAVWYTDWFKEKKILGTEDNLAIRSLVVPGSKEPAARVILQYDSDGDGEIDAESKPIDLGRDEQVHEVPDVPIDEDGFYRIKITEYSGYNSLYALDTAIVH